MLAWLTVHLGDATTWLRLPSVLAGAATVPVVFLLGDAIAGRRSGITAAALFAVMPFAVYYGSEARPYALLTFLVALSTLALLRALDSKSGVGWWIVYWLACVLALLTHYVAGFALPIQASWALLTQRDKWRAVLAANAAVVLLFLPWTGRIGEGDRLGKSVLNVLHPLTWDNIVNDPLRVAIGHPYALFGQVPGNFSLVVGGLALALIAVGLFGPRLLRSVGQPVPAVLGGESAPQSWRLRGRLNVPRVGWLLVALTAGTLAATAVYSALNFATIYSPRHVITVAPYVCLIVGIATAALPRRLALVSAGALVLAASLASVRVLADYPRPDMHAAADAIEARAPAGTPVVEPWRLGFDTERGQNGGALQQDLAIYLDDRYPLSIGLSSGRDWPSGRQVFAVTSGPAQTAQVTAAAQQAGDHLVETLTFPSFHTITVSRFVRGAGVAPSRAETIGAYLQQHPEALRAYLEQHPEARKRFNRAVQAQLGAR
jgi:hypothetical protein